MSSHLQASVTLAPLVPGLSALGAESVDDLMGTRGRMLDEDRAERVSSGSGFVLLRVPLPGTPDEGGRRGALTGRPRGAGTGYVFVRRYSRAGLWPSLVARFTAPRSASLAEREWNLLCHLRGAGVATPEPMAVASAPAGVVSRRSVVVTRALEDVLPALEWFAKPQEPEVRRRAVRALGDVLARIVSSGTYLPELTPKHLFVAPVDLERGCFGSGLRLRRVPGIAVGSVRGGRLRGKIGVGELQRMLARLLAGSPAPSSLSQRELLTVLSRSARPLGAGAAARLGDKLLSSAFRRAGE